jgi:hypothetical protein
MAVKKTRAGSLKTASQVKMTDHILIPPDPPKFYEPPSVSLEVDSGFEVRNLDTNEFFFSCSRKGILEFLAGPGNDWLHFTIAAGKLPSQLLYGGSLCQ